MKYEIYANLHLGFLDPEMILHFSSHLFYIFLDLQLFFDAVDIEPGVQLMQHL